MNNKTETDVAIQKAVKPLLQEIERLWSALKIITPTEKGFDSNRDINLMRKGKYWERNFINHE